MIVHTGRIVLAKELAMELVLKWVMAEGGEKTVPGPTRC
jgi:hypothetical protein